MSTSDTYEVYAIQYAYRAERKRYETFYDNVDGAAVLRCARRLRAIGHAHALA